MKRRIAVHIIRCASTAVLLTPTVARAQFITSASALGTPTQVVTFSQFLTETFPTVNVSQNALLPVMLSTTTPQPQFRPAITNEQYAVGGYFPEFPELNDPRYCSNGLWDSGRQGFVRFFPGTVARFTFGGAAVSGVGAFLNYVPLCSQPNQGAPTLRLLGANDVVLASYNIDALGRITTPNQLNVGAFRGAMRTEGDIYAVEFVGAYMVLDDLTYTLAAPTTPPPSTSVPEPSTTALLAVGITVLGLARRPRRSRRPARESEFAE